MKILILSPLFPPDTGASAGYVKELATRMQPSHEINLLVYGYLPESVPKVIITSVDKRSFLPVRLFLYARAVLRHKSQDIIFLNNAPSVELPFFLISLFRNIPFILIESDEVALEASKRGWYKVIHKLILKRAKKVISLEGEKTYKKAEVLPFAKFDTAREARREAWWNTHLNQLMS